MTERFLPAFGPWDIGATLTTLGHHSIPGAHRTDTTRGTHSRVLAVGGGHHIIDLRLTPAGVHWRVSGHARAAGVPDESALEPLLRWWFDLDAEIETIDAHLRGDPLLAGQVADRPGIRITRHPDAAAGVLTTILGQQVSLAAGRTFAGRLAAVYGDETGAGLRAFPAPARLAAVDGEDLRAAIGLTGARARTLREAAALLAEHPAPPDAPYLLAEDMLTRLADLPGVGPWTISILALRGRGEGDALPASDLVLRRAMGGLTAPAVTTAAEAWRPHRGYAVVRLWAGAGAADGGFPVELVGGRAPADQAP
ncbi:DNA-3-methyladenine glycosylase family protein [Pseudactinotalea sp. Z1739]|uniref:DNA-3-methyladenine glycosylase family protein n=1 Tax=Pseudactinotalea sp. Z1739 TaxID=3413028 RepID=UPI003C7AEC97